VTLGMRASDRRIIIRVGITRRDRRCLRPGKAVLLPGRQLAVPVDDGRCTGLIHKIEVKALAGRKRNARFSVRPDKAEYSRRFAVNGESSGAGSQAKRSGAGFGRGSCPCVYRQLKRGRSGGEVRPGWRVI
jgi:hypothetical protein